LNLYYKIFSAFDKLVADCSLYMASKRNQEITVISREALHVLALLERGM